MATSKEELQNNKGIEVSQEQQKANLLDISSLLEKSIDQLKEENGQLQRMHSLTEDITDKIEIQTEIEKNLIKIKQEEIEASEKILEEEEKKLETLKEQLEVEEQKNAYTGRDKEKIKILSEEIDGLKQATQHRRDKNKEDLKELKNRKEAIKASREYIDGLRQADDLADNTLSLFGLDRKAFNKTFIGRLTTSSQKMGGYGASLKHVGKQTVEALKPHNLLSQALQSISYATIKLAAEQQQSQATFNQATGAAGEYDSTIRQIGREQATFGVSSSEAAEALAALREEFSNLTMMSMGAQKEVGEFTAQMASLGVDANITAVNMQHLTKTVGLSVDGAMHAQREIAATAVELGVSPRRMADEFAKAAPRLAAFGKDGVKAFKDLAVAAKATGIEVSKLLDLTEKFETFEGAAESVGKLNAVLGGPFLDSMTMTMTTDPTERIKMLRQAVDDAGLSFESMGHFQRRAIADAMGLSDVSDLSRVLSGDINEMSAAAKAEALSKKEMADMSAKAQTVMKKLGHVLNSIAVQLGPLIDALSTVVTWILKAFDAVSKLVPSIGGNLIPGILTVVAVFVTLRHGMKLVGRVAGKTAEIMGKSFGKALSEAGKGAGKAIENLGKGAAEAGKSATKAVPGLLALGAAVLLIGGGIALATLGISTLAESIKGMTGTEMLLFVGILAAIAVGLLLLAKVSLVAVIPLLLLGAALLLMGAGIALIGAGVLMISTGLSMVIDSLSQFSNESVKNLASVADAVRNIMSAISELPLLKALMFTGMVMSVAHAADQMQESEGGSKAFTEVIQSTNKLETKAVENVEELVKQARIYKETQEDMSSSALDPFIDMIKSALGTGGAKTGAAAGPNNLHVTLEIGGRQLDKYVINLMEEHLKPRRS